MTIRVLLVDDQMLVRQGIQSLLGLSESIEVVGQAQDGEEALTKLESLDVDVILLDIRMPRMDGITTLKTLATRENAPPVLMLTTFDDHETVLDTLKAGAKGFLLKDVSLEVLVDAIETIAAGGTLIQPAVTASLIRGINEMTQTFDSAVSPEALSDKEREVLRLMAAGLSNQEIASAMYKSLGTVKNQVSTVLAKMGVRDRTRAVLKAIENGLI